MKEKYAILIAILLCSVTISGCMGDDSEERIDDLEVEIIQNKGFMESLNQTIEVQTAEISSLRSLAASLNATNDQFERRLAMVDDGVTQDDVDAAREEGRTQGISEASPFSTLDVILQRGSLKCGVKESQWGMGYLDAATGIRTGLDIEYCMALAAAIGLNPHTDIEYILATGSNRFELLATGDIDVLIRTTTWTGSRDADLDADYAAVNFYDGQGILIRGDIVEDDGDYSPSDLDGMSICVGLGTTTEGNLVGWADSNGLNINFVYVDSSWEATQYLIDGDCAAFSGDISALVARKYILEADGTCGVVADPDDEDCDGLWIAPETLSKEPLAAVTRDYDSEWNEVVSWTWYGMITAEELGVHSGNFASFGDVCTSGGEDYDYQICNLLEDNLGLGTPSNPLSNNWMKDVLMAVGNYGEAYDRSFCDGTYDGISGSDAMSGCIFPRSGTLNALVSEGGIQYAPSWR
tara:strand:+ start:112 stop:1509 length:1398 start_codon:yes stop_codon:yes gene_type:complete